MNERERALDRARGARYRERHKDRVKEMARIRTAKYRKRHKERLAEERREKYRQWKSNRDKARQWREEHREHLKKIKRAWQIKNKEKSHIANRRYEDSHKSERASAKRRWRKKNPEKAAEIKRRWMEKNPIPVRLNQLARKANRRARLMACEGKFSWKDVQALREKQKHRCAYCDKKVGFRFEVDHIIPLARGGTNWPSNLAISCRKCNRSKWHKTDWVPA